MRGVVSCLVLVLLAGCGPSTAETEVRIEELRAELASLGYPLDLPEPERGGPNDAAVLLANVYEVTWAVEDVDYDDLDGLRTILQEDAGLARSIDFIEEANAVYPLGDWSDPAALLLPYAETFKRLCQYSQAEAIVLAEDGQDPLPSLRECSDLMLIFDSFPNAITRLVELAAHRIAMENALRIVELRPDLRADLADHVASLRTPDLESTLRLELAFNYAAIDSVTTLEESFSSAEIASVPDAKVLFLENAIKLVQAWPDRERIERLDALDDGQGDMAYDLFAILWMDWGQILDQVRVHEETRAETVGALRGSG